MAIRSSSSSGVPFGGTAGRPASPGNGQPYFNGDVGRLELYTTATGWQNIVQETPGVASASGTYNQSAGSGTFTISGTNFVSGAIVYAVGTNGIEYEATSTTFNSLVQITTTFSNLSVAYEPYDIKVTNPSNLFGLLPDAFYINDTPLWSTAAGSLGDYTGSNIQLAATDDESNTITYSLLSGSLPAGLSLSSSGLISGAANATAGTYTFTVSASDGINTAVTRSFSVTIPTSVAGGTLSSDATYYYRTFSANGNLVVSGSNLTSDFFIVAGGGPGGGAGGGGAGGVRGISSVSLSAGTYPAAIGSGGAGATSTGGPTTYTGLGTNSSFNNISATRGGGGGGFSLDLNGTTGGSGGGGGNNASSVHSGSSGNSGGYSPVEGYAGGSGGHANYTNGGGGGAGGNGDSSTSSRSGNGGPGIQNSISGTTYFWGGGGGGGAQGSSLNGGNGGIGGGGGGTCSTGATGGSGGTSALNSGGTGTSGGSQVAGNGGVNTGGGGGGMATSVGTSGNGGSGIVVVRYTKTQVGG